MNLKLHALKQNSLMLVVFTILAIVPGLKGWGQTLYEDYNYTVPGNIGGNTSASGTTNNNWTTHSNSLAGTIDVLSGSLNYAGLVASTGNKVFIPGANTVVSRDVNRTGGLSAGQNIIYFSFLLNVVDNTQLSTSATFFTSGANGYFIHMATTSGASAANFYGRVGIRSTTSGATFRLGIANFGNAFTEVTSDYSFGTTYLIVIKYSYVISGTDVATIWVNPVSLGGTEPTGSFSNSSQAGNVGSFVSSTSSICIRNSSNTPKAHIDEIRIGTTWAEVTPVGVIPSVIVSPSSLTNFTYTGTGPSPEQNFTVSGTNLTAALSLTPPADYEISTGTGGSFVATNPITLTPASGTVPTTTIYVRLKSGLAAGAYNNENIVAASAGATSQNVTCSGVVTTNFYSASSGNLDQTTSWGTNTDGTGTNPANFASDGQVFNIRNNSTPAIGANWIVSGAGSKIILGNGIAAVSFTITSTFSLTGTIDISANGTLTIQNSVIPTLGTLNSASTVVYDGAGTQNITLAAYGNLTLSSAGTKTFAGNITTVAGNLLISNTTVSAPAVSPFATLNLGGDLTYAGTVTPPGDANSITLVTTGTGLQTITTNGNTARWFRLKTTSPGNNVVLSETGVPGNLYVGNLSGGGTDLAAGSQLTLNANTLTFFNGNGTILGTGTITCNGSSNIIMNRIGTTTGSAFGTLNLTPGANMLNDLTLNLTGIGTTVTLGSDVLIGGMLSLTNGSINLGGKVLSYTPFGMLVYNNLTLGTTSGIEFPATGGPGMVIVMLTPPTGISLHASRTIESGLSIVTGQKFIIPDAVNLTVNGQLENLAGPSGLVVKSGGSLIHANAGVSATVERAITAWGDYAHGWHHLSSPVASQAIRPEFVPSPVVGSAQDFYAWSETNGYWFNSKDDAGNWETGFDANFLPGKGYLVAYLGDVTKNFSGTLNVASVSITGLTNTPAAYPPGDITPGWHLLGNPFASALTWGTSGWALSNVTATAKIWKESTASYVDLQAGSGIIPAMNGFMVETSGGGTLTIPATDRVHNATPWYKTTSNPGITLVATNTDAKTAQESVVIFNREATPGFNPAFDSHFLPGYAPSFYSLDGAEKLSTNVLPSIDNQTAIPFSFIKTNGSNYTIEAVQIENVPAQVFLTDLKLNKTQNLGENPVYPFTADDGDSPARFLLSFSHVGIGENTGNTNEIYSYENNLYLTGPGKARLEVYNLTGRKLLAEEINCPGLYKTTLNCPTGYYVVRLTTGTKVFVTKVFIKS